MPLDTMLPDKPVGAESELVVGGLYSGSSSFPPQDVSMNTLQRAYNMLHIRYFFILDFFMYCKSCLYYIDLG